MTVVHQDDLESRPQAMRSFLIGSAVMCVAYMLPIVGSWWTWAMAGVFGPRRLDAGVLHRLPAARNPKAGRRKVKVAAPDAPPAAPRRPSSADPSPVVAYAAAVAAPEPRPPKGRCTPRVAPPVEPVPGPRAASELVLLPPRGVSPNGSAAFILDLILILITVAGAETFDREWVRHRVSWLALAYHVTFWTLKGDDARRHHLASCGSVRIDGEPVGFSRRTRPRNSPASSRLAVFGIGFLWILKDPDRQAWHDRVAGHLRRQSAAHMALFENVPSQEIRRSGVTITKDDSPDLIVSLLTRGRRGFPRNDTDHRSQLLPCVCRHS